MRIAYDPVLKRPGCALLQACLGGDSELLADFPAETWLTYPTQNLGVFEVTPEQLAHLVRVTRAAAESAAKTDAGK